MTQRRIVRLVAVVAVITLIGTACSSKKGPGATPGAKAGGTFRIQSDELPWSVSGNGFDPSFEYLTLNWELLDALMIRPLMGYNHRSVGGSKVIPDLATGPGEYSADHMQITYKLRTGVKFGPPVSRDITSKDIAYAMERVATENLDTGGYPSYYTDFLKGAHGLAKDGTYTPMDGIETPDDSTIIFKFVKPANDWDFRMAMPASAPIPPEIGKCFTKQLEYGQYIISSGPYMIQGIDQLDPSSCTAFKSKKPTGFNFSKELDLVRSTTYDATKDSKEQREALPDKFVFSLNTNAKDCFARTEQNRTDFCAAAATGDVIQHFKTTPALAPQLHAFYDNADWYVSMNLTEPPFDDVHVRKAFNWALNKDGLRRLRGGPDTGDVAEHMVPPSLLNGQLASGQFDPYGPTHSGNVAKAKEEMKLSAYDKNHDGLCDDQSAVAGENRTVCGAKGNEIVVINRATDPFPAYEPVFTAALKAIGITVRYAEGPGFYGRAGRVKDHVVLGTGGGWGPDWPEPDGFFEQVVTSGAIHAQTYNTGLLGITKEQAKTLGANFPAGGVPSVDADFAACAKMAVGSAERLTCWENLDKKLTTEIVPWVPYRWSKRVDVLSAAAVGFDSDPYSSEISLAHIGIDTAKQVLS